MNKAIYCISKEMGAGTNADDRWCVKCKYCGLHFRDFDRLKELVTEHMELYHSGIYLARPNPIYHFEYSDGEWGEKHKP